jgi:ATP phosphoribosyltransferase
VVKLKDLQYGECKLSVCAVKNLYKSITDLPSQIRVATTFPNIARDYFNKLGIDVEIINLYGSVELAPLVGLSDVIVDLVASGKTLEENNLEVIETIMDCTSILIANQSSFKLYRDRFLLM